MHHRIVPFAVSVFVLCLGTPALADLAFSAAKHSEKIGRHRDDPQLAAEVRQLGEHKVMKLDDEEPEYYYIFPKLGLEIHFEADHTVGAVAFLNENAFMDDHGAHAAFAGALPGGLTFSDDEATARRKLGEPSETEFYEDEDEYILTYEEKGIYVGYSRESKDAPPGMMLYVNMTIPSKE